VVKGAARTATSLVTTGSWLTVAVVGVAVGGSGVEVGCAVGDTPAPEVGDAVGVAVAPEEPGAVAVGLASA
jgi:hypothetical protein